MHPPVTVAQTVGMFWFLAWIGVTIALHFRLVGKLKAMGVLVPYWLQNQPWVEWKYVDVCRERQIDPWPSIRWVVLCWLMSLPGIAVVLVSLAR